MGCQRLERKTRSPRHFGDLDGCERSDKKAGKRGSALMIKVVGLGIGNLDDLSRKAASLLQSTSRLITTASWHPVFSSLDKAHIEVWDGFSPEEITSRLNQVGEGEDVVLAVSGDPVSTIPFKRLKTSQNF